MPTTQNRIARALLGHRGIKRVGLSNSDNVAYPQFCHEASVDPVVFSTFRQNRTYRKILEHVSEEQGQEYLRWVAEDEAVLAAMPSIKENDLYGGPKCFEYEGVGSVSPSTLRYAKVLADLKRLFGSLDGLRICEIGVGYGGQCRAINALFRPASYCLVDIAPALALTQRYLDHYVLSSTIAYKTMHELEAQSYDLVISNYAYSELRRTLQDVYFKRVINGAKRGYITHNQITPPEFSSYSAAEIVSKVEGARIEEERPLTYPGNCVIVWGDA